MSLPFKLYWGNNNNVFSKKAWAPGSWPVGHQHGVGSVRAGIAWPGSLQEIWAWVRAWTGESCAAFPSGMGRTVWKDGIVWELYEGTCPAEVLLEDCSAAGGRSVPLVLFVWTLEEMIRKAAPRFHHAGKELDHSKTRYRSEVKRVQYGQSEDQGPGSRTSYVAGTPCAY